MVFRFFSFIILTFALSGCVKENSDSKPQLELRIETKTKDDGVTNLNIFIENKGEKEVLMLKAKPGGVFHKIGPTTFCLSKKSEESPPPVDFISALNEYIGDSSGLVKDTKPVFYTSDLLKIPSSQAALLWDFPIFIPKTREGRLIKTRCYYQFTQEALPKDLENLSDFKGIVSVVLVSNLLEYKN